MTAQTISLEGLPTPFCEAVEHLVAAQRRVLADRRDADAAWERGRKGDSTSLHGAAHFKQKAINTLVEEMRKL